jgi:hypothetical protein
MDIKAFWELIDKTREATNGDARKQSDLLTEELTKLHPEEIISFQRIFYDLKDKAYIGNLWDAATIIKMNGCGDDGFQEFREWLVGRGKEAYENAIKDPETLVNVLEASQVIFPTLLCPAMDAYEKITGKDMPPNPREWPELQGRTTINIDKEETELLTEISARFPKLTAKFWEWWRRDKIYLEIHDMLGKILIPLGFLEGEIKSLQVIKFQRNQFTVETMLDSDNFGFGYYISFFVSDELSQKGYPIHQDLMSLYYHEYNEEKKKSLHVSIKEWIASVGLQ